MITANIIEDSYYADGWGNTHRITTMVLSYPRFVHAELLTHRVFSRNASSSRAIPIGTMIDRAINHTAYPVHWGKNQKGMQADEELSPKDQERAKGLWAGAAQMAARYAMELANVGVHKQIANRLIENFQNIEVVVTSTKWANFFALRNHPDAQPEIQELARQMLKAYRNSKPTLLSGGQWHLPFVGKTERIALEDTVACKISSARCARVSYLTHDKRKPTVEEDLQLFERLMGGNPKHASPTEHQAMVPTQELYDFSPELFQSNLGSYWVQYRKTIPNESIDTYDDIQDD